MSARLILLRHGESEWNALDLFSGWVDVGLSARGEEEAIHGGRLMVGEGLLPEVVHTSVLRRAIRTAELALEASDRSWIPVRRSWRLNERHYGALQGKNKGEVRERFGDDQFMRWRRSYDEPPPPLPDDDRHSQVDDPRYAALPSEARPRTECLKDVVGRMLPYWYDAVVPDLRAVGTVLVVAHGNSLRALVKHLDGMSDEAVVSLNLPTGIPLLYELDDDMRPSAGGGRYLDPDAAVAAIEAVKNQGRR
jgi:2,3-bisphosphoglycerate-dependent phosphoglycerate mutase